MKNKFDLNKVAKGIRPVLEASLILIGNEAKNHFVGSFRLQGFQDVNVDKWKPRKKQDKRAGRAILVKSGDLRRSIRRESLNKARLSVTIATDLPYARIHNEGLEGKAWGKAPFKMPQRRFIGHSTVMNDKIKKTITKQINNLFKK